MAGGTEFCNPSNVTAGICNTVRGSINPSLGEVEYTDYGYVVASWASFLFIALFGAATLAHILIGSLKRQWWTVFTVALGAAVETIGWGGRVMSATGLKWNENLGGFWQYPDNSFIIQVVCLIIAPVFFSAANYILLGRLINATGGHYSLVTSKSFAIIFMFGDFICLVIQGAGGGWAATAGNKKDSDNGALVMTAGVILQLVITVAFVGLLVDFVRRYRSNKPAFRQRHILPNKGWFRRNDTRPIQNTSNDMSMQSLSPSTGQLTPNKFERIGGTEGAGPSGTTSSVSTRAFESSERLITPKGVSLMIGLLAVTTLLIVIRSVYRSVELTDGWDGPVATNQALFLALDALLMALLVLVYLPLHPGFFLPRLKL